MWEYACVSCAGFMAGSGTTAATSDTTIMPMLAVGTSSGAIFLVSVASFQVASWTLCEAAWTRSRRALASLEALWPASRHLALILM